MTDYGLLNFAGDKGEPRPGLKVADHVLDLAPALEALGRTGDTFSPTSTLAILQDWPSAEPALQALADEFDAADAGRFAARPLGETRLMAPILYPPAIFCAFANFTDHMQEMSGRTPPDKTKVKPFFFAKLPCHTVIGPEDPIGIPAFSEKLDWEAELGVVIGRAARNVAKADAMDYVAGYTIINDMSLRDMGNRQDWDIRHDFLSGKSFDSGAPMGPWIVPAKQIKDPYALDMKQWVNDELMQDSSSKFMHFTIDEQIAHLSGKLTLRPGDVIATGSPSGNGRPRGIFLKPGDEVTVKIDGIGTLHNPIVQGA